MKKKFIKSALLLIMTFLVIGCNTKENNDNSTTNSDDKVEDSIKLKAGSIMSPTSVSSITAEKVFASINEETGGKVEIEYFDSSQLGNGEAQLENLRTGLQDIIIGDPGWLVPLDNDYNILGMPYAFRDLDHYDAFLRSEIFEKMKSKLIDEWGIRILASNWYRAPRVLQTTKQIKSVGDVKGLIWRVPDIPIFVEHAKQMDATPTPLAYGEVYMGFQQNLIEGHDPTYEEVYPMKFYEVAPYILETESTYSTQFILIREEAFQELSAEQQQVLIEEANAGGLLHVELIEEQLNEQKEEMIADGVVITQADREAFREKVLPMAERLENEGLWSKGLFDEVQKIK